jgi:hypothetical protein
MSNQSQDPICMEKQLTGNCSKGINCQQCNNSPISKQLENVSLNTGAKAWVPKTKRQDPNPVQSSQTSDSNPTSETNKLQFNLQAQAYVPKTLNQFNPDDYNLNQDQGPEEEVDAEEFDMIMKDIINNEAMEELEEEESDDEKWYPKFKDCECCKGFVYKCKGTACVNMNVCYCKMQEECEAFEEL